MTTRDPFDIASDLDLPLAGIELSAELVVTDELTLALAVSCRPGDCAPLAGDPCEDRYDRLFVEGSVNARNLDEGVRLSRSILLAPVVAAAVELAHAQSRLLIRDALARMPLADLAQARLRVRLHESVAGAVARLHTERVENLPAAA